MAIARPAAASTAASRTINPPAAQCEAPNASRMPISRERLAAEQFLETEAASGLFLYFLSSVIRGLELARFHLSLMFGAFRRTNLGIEDLRLGGRHFGRHRLARLGVSHRIIGRLGRHFGLRGIICRGMPRRVRIGMKVSDMAL